MVDNVDAIEVVGKTTLQPPEVRSCARSVESTTSSSTIRIDRSFSSCSTKGPGAGGARARTFASLKALSPNDQTIYLRNRPAFPTLRGHAIQPNISRATSTIRERWPEQRSV